MGIVYTDIILENTGDITSARRGLLKAADIRRLEAHALVDTGAWNLVINEKTRVKLGLDIVGEDEIEAAGGITEKCGITEEVTIRWKNRFVTCNAVVLPMGDDVLLGAFPLEGMDLMVHPRLEEVVGAHGDKQLMIVK